MRRQTERSLNDARITDSSSKEAFHLREVRLCAVATVMEIRLTWPVPKV